MEIHKEDKRSVEYEGPNINDKHFAMGCFLLTLTTVLLISWLLIR